MINFLNTLFIKSASKLSEAPGNDLPEVLLCGKSNVGKSSFINSLCRNSKLAYTSSKPGHTQLLNYYNVDNKIYLVDAPGYGYAAKGIDLDKLFMTMMDEYFSNGNLKLVLVLLDSRRKISDDDINLINFLIEKKLKIQIIFTKCDKINQKEKAALEKNIHEVGMYQNYLFTSILDIKTFDAVKNEINKII